jgi:hypothetical protein
MFPSPLPKPASFKVPGAFAQALALHEQGRQTLNVRSARLVASKKAAMLFSSYWYRSRSLSCLQLSRSVEPLQIDD